jgi:hypothetical protein
MKPCVDNLICRECGITYYSAAVAAMIARGERCDCGGLLIELSADVEDQGVNLTVITSPSRIA